MYARCETAAALLLLLEEYNDVQSLNLSSQDCARLTDAGLREIALLVRVETGLRAVVATEAQHMARHSTADSAPRTRDVPSTAMCERSRRVVVRALV